MKCFSKYGKRAKTKEVGISSPLYNGWEITTLVRPMVKRSRMQKYIKQRQMNPHHHFRFWHCFHVLMPQVTHRNIVWHMWNTHKIAMYTSKQSIRAISWLAGIYFHPKKWTKTTAIGSKDRATNHISTVWSEHGRSGAHESNFPTSCWCVLTTTRPVMHCGS